MTIRRLLIAAIVAITGCGGVQAHQRAKLAKPKMQMNPYPEAASLEQHVFTYREGSAGGYDSGGGGCGCN